MKYPFDVDQLTVPEGMGMVSTTHSKALTEGIAAQHGQFSVGNLMRVAKGIVVGLSNCSFTEISRSPSAFCTANKIRFTAEKESLKELVQFSCLFELPGTEGLRLNEVNWAWKGSIQLIRTVFNYV